MNIAYSVRRVLSTATLLFAAIGSVSASPERAFKAMEEGNFRAFLSFAETLEGEKINTSFEEFSGETLLIASARLGRLDMVAYLLSQPEICIDCQDDLSFTALLEASSRGHLEVVDLLLRRGANVNLPANGGVTPLMLASARGQAAVVGRILQEGNIKVDAQNLAGQTALHWAFLFGVSAEESFDLPIGDGILEVSVDIEKLLGELVRQGAEGAEETWDLFQEMKRVSERIVVHTVRRLVAAGSNPNLQDEDGDTPLYFASAVGNLEAVKVLLEGGAELERSVNLTGITPLMAAVSSGNSDLVEFFLREKAQDPNARTMDGRTTLHAATAGSQVPMVNLLMENGARIDERDVIGMTPLLWGLYVGTCRDTVACLIDKWNANTEAADVDGDGMAQLAAYQAVASKNFDVLEYVLSRFAELRNHRNNDGQRFEEILKLDVEVFEQWQERELKFRM